MKKALIAIVFWLIMMFLPIIHSQLFPKLRTITHDDIKAVWMVGMFIGCAWGVAIGSSIGEKH